MDDLPQWLPVAIVVVAIAVLVAVWFASRKRAAQAPTKPGNNRPRGLDALDTLQSWAPERSRILTGSERQAFAVLRKALPEHMILAQVPLARFLRVPTRNSYNEWMRRVGQLCADILVCNSSSEVIAVIEIRQPPAQESERGVKRHARMDRVLTAAGIALHVWREDVLPTPAAAREAILGAAAGLSPHEISGGGQARPFGMAGAPLAASALPLLEDDLPEATELHGHREPPPSTWFDDLDGAETDRARLEEDVKSV
ncbi:MAG: DUF2726 domain-containing protein [Aquabacterium sp.]|nr:MAG: DUF2726 domain-containing protein [Aquabacterium sp.]